MKSKIDLYKKISLELLELLKNEDIDNLDGKLEQREVILKDIDNVDKFRELAIKTEVIELEKEISHLFNTKVNEAKKEIIEYKKSKQANNTYVSLSKEKLNIFIKKV